MKTKAPIRTEPDPVCHHPGCDEFGCFGEGWPIVEGRRHWCRKHVPEGFFELEKGKTDGT